ncbi:MAG: hypothetical protein WKG00_12995 [Polyangiaceae bacterium]
MATEGRARARAPGRPRWRHGVAQEVDERTAATLRDAEDDGQLVGVAMREEGRQAVHGQRRLVEPGGRRHRGDHVETLGAGGHRHRLQPERQQLVAHHPRRAAHQVHLACRRIEVDHEAVGREQLLRAHRGDVQLDDVLVGEVDEALGVAHHRVLGDAALLGDLDALDERRVVRGGVLLEEALPAHPAREALQAQRPPGGVLQDARRRAAVPLDHLALGVARLGEDDALGVGDGDHARAEAPPGDLAPVEATRRAGSAP